MNVTINVDEAKFQEILEKELKAFSSEELHDILKEAIKRFLNDNDLIRSLFIQQRNDYYSNIRVQPTQFLTDIVKTIDLSKDCEEIKDSMVSVIKTEAGEIVTGLFAKAIAKSLFDHYEREGWLSEAIFQEVKSMQNN